MSRLQAILATIRRHLGELNTTHKLLLGSVVVIMLLALVVVGQVSSAARTVELLPGAPAEEQRQAHAALQAAGFPSTMRDGRVHVPVAQRTSAMAQLVQTDRLPADTSILFSNLLDKPKWNWGRAQTEQAIRIAKQNELAQVIASMEGIASARVFLDAPSQPGLGRAYRPPTASVAVFTRDGSPLPQDMVDKIAHFVAGAEAGLDASRVRVVDGTTGRARSVSDQQGLAASSYRDYARAVEQQFRDKLYALVSDIEGVVVEVTAHVDVTRRQSESHKTLPKGEGSEQFIRSESRTETTESVGALAAEPGVRSNQTADINAAGGGETTRSSRTEEQSEFDAFPGTLVERIDDPRGQPTWLVATINVPRAHVAELLKRAAQPADGAEAAPTEPTPAQIEQFFQEQERPRIEARIRPHLRTVDAEGQTLQGEVVVSLAEVELPAVAGRGAMAGPGGAGSLLAMKGGMVENIVLAALALVSLGMMALLVRRASRRLELPSAEEIAGVPPPLHAPSDLVGEAGESEAAMAGIEIDDAQLKAQKILEQVAELVHQSPEVASRLLHRWIATDD